MYFLVFILYLIIFLLTDFVPIGFAFMHNESLKISPIQIDLLDSGGQGLPPLFCASSSSTDHRNCSDSTDLYLLRLTGSSDLNLFFPFLRKPSLTVKLYRDSFLNRRLADQLNYNVYVTDAINDGTNQTRVDIEVNAQSAIGYFRGHIIIEEESTDSTDSPSFSSSAILAIGSIDRRSGVITIQAFIRYANTILYLRPRSGFFGSGHEGSRHSNSYLISLESESFYQMFERQFRHNLKSQQKRSAPIDNRCPLIIYVDYSLFAKLNHDRTKSVLFVNFAFNFANEIFLRTKFTRTGYSSSWVKDDDIEETIYEDYGHSLCQIVIEERPPQVIDDLFNAGLDYWSEKALTSVLRNLKHRDSHCLAYLFTNLKINDSRYSDVNGYAMIESIFSNRKEVPNSGAVSFAACEDPWNWYCVLNFVHELGHNWGSPHDPDAGDCISPENGSYIMRMPFLEVYGSNNLLFSPCSIRAIYRNIDQKINPQEFKSWCSKCGNGHVEYPEECDEGQFSGNCCSVECKLLKKEKRAKCSHYNHDCCDEKCQLKSRTEVCRSSDPLFCWQEARCDGRDLFCPKATKMPDGSRCSHGGVCQQGYCNSSCPADTHVECKCPSLLDQCFSCCRETLFIRDHEGNLISSGDGSQASCLPFVPLRDGTPCRYTEDTFGKCLSGECAKYEIVIEDVTTETKRVVIWALVLALIAFFVLMIGMPYALWALRRVAKNRFQLNEDDFEVRISESVAKEVPLHAIEALLSEENGGERDNSQPRRNGSSSSSLRGHHSVRSTITTNGRNGVQCTDV